MYNKIVSTQRSAGQILLIAATLDQEHTNLRVAAPELSSPQRLQRISVSARSTLAAFPRNRPGSDLRWRGWQRRDATTELSSKNLTNRSTTGGA